MKNRIIGVIQWLYVETAMLRFDPCPMASIVMYRRHADDDAEHRQKSAQFVVAGAP